MHLLVFCSVLSRRRSSYVSGQALTFLEGPGVFLCVSEICSWAVITQSMPHGWAHHKNLVLPLGFCLRRALYSGNALVHGPYLAWIKPLWKQASAWVGCHAFDSRLNIEPHRLPQSTERPKVHELEKKTLSAFSLPLLNFGIRVPYRIHVSHLILRARKIAQKPLCLSAPYPAGKLMLVCQYTQFALGRDEEMTHSTLSNWKINSTLLQAYFDSSKIHQQLFESLPYTNGITLEMAMSYLAFIWPSLLGFFHQSKGVGKKAFCIFWRPFFACKAKIFFSLFIMGGKMAHFLNQFTTDPPLPLLKASLKKVKVPIVGGVGCLWWSKRWSWLARKDKAIKIGIKMVSSHNIWFDFYYLYLFRCLSSYINNF